MNRIGTVVTVGVGFGALVSAAYLAYGGPLNPPAGAVSPSYKTLTEVEPRTMLSAANTPGDANSVFKITQAGSYYLGGVLFATPGKSGIEVAAADVTIDLNGFTISGEPGSLDGVDLSSGAAARVTVKNGKIFACGRDGINGENSGPAHLHDLQILNCPRRGIGINSGTIIERCTVELCGGAGGAVPNGGIGAGNAVTVIDCQVNQNFGVGISCGTASIVKGCDAIGNTGPGIVINAGFSGQVMDCTADTNGGDGISVPLRSNVHNCHARGNGGNGIVTGDESKIDACTAALNGDSGIVAASSSTVIGCAANGNGTNAAGTTRDGIACATGCTVTACTASGNGDDGITMSSFGTISGCTTWNNTDDGIFAPGGGTIIRECSCTGNLGDGITVNADCLVVGNICDNHNTNGAAGIRTLGSDCRVENNNCTDNNQGVRADAPGNIFLANTCSGNTTNYSMVAGNFALVVNAASAGIISGSSGGTALGTTDPRANLSF